MPRPGLLVAVPGLFLSASRRPLLVPSFYHNLLVIYAPIMVMSGGRCGRFDVTRTSDNTTLSSLLADRTPGYEGGTPRLVGVSHVCAPIWA